MLISHRDDFNSDLMADLLPALDALRLGMLTLSPEGIITYANAHFDYVFDQGTLTSKSVGQTFPAAMRALIDAGEIGGTAALEDPDGWIDAQMQAVDFMRKPLIWHMADGRVLEWKFRNTPDTGRIGVCEDVTTRERDANRFVDAIDTAIDAFALWDQRGRLTYTNQRFAQVHGQALQSCPIGTQFNEYCRQMMTSTLLAEPTGRDAADQLMSCFASPLGQLTLHFTTGKWYLMSTRRMRDGGVAMIITDITELKERETELIQRGKSLESTICELEMVQERLEDQGNDLVLMAEKLQVSARKAEAASEAKTVFLRSVSHELRTPLNAIIGFADVMRHKFHGPLGNDKYESFVEDISRSGHYLLELITKLLDASRMESGQFELQISDFELGELLHQVEQNVAEHMDRHQVKLAVAAPDKPIKLRADQLCLQQVVINPLTNAAKFSDAGQTIQLAVTQQDGGLLFTVDDTGCGIPSDQIERILRPFEQVRECASHAHEGTGLGLSIAKTMIELHGGWLELTSEIEQGTTVRIWLPGPASE